MNELDIIYEDADYILLNKQSGMLTIPDRFSRDIPNLYNILKERYSAIFIVHRLDKDTSGIICFAKNAQAHREFNLLFEKGEIRKTYIALVCGKMKEKEGKIELKIGHDSSQPGIMTIDNAYGKESITNYTVVEEFKNYSLVEAMPLTGRTHQIRIHFQSTGNPLAVDPVYGYNKELFLSGIKHGYKLKQGETEKPIISRLTLHASKLMFSHCGKNEQVEFTAPLHKDFEIILKHLRKWGK